MAGVMNSWWHRLQVKWAGVRDGKARLPREADSTPAEYERQLIQQGEQILSGLAEARARKGAKVVAAQDDAVGQAKRVVGQFKAKYHEYDLRKRTLGRGVLEHLGQVGYWVLLIGIGVGELALNFQAFQVFEKPLGLTLLMSLVVAICLPASAHFIGLLLKQWPAPAWRTAALIGCGLIVGAVCLNAVNIARAQYLLGPTGSVTSRSEALEQAFFGINLLVFFAAIIASYFAHDADQDFANMRRAFFALDRQCSTARARLTAIVKDLETIEQVHQAKANHVRSIVGELVLLYRRNNRRHRDDDPQAFRVEPVLPVGQGDPLRILNRSEIDELFRDWADVDRTPERQPLADVGSAA